MRYYDTLLLKIVSGASLSPAQSFKSATGQRGNPLQPSLRLYGLLMPAVWTAASLTFQFSPDNGKTFGNVYSDAGVEYTVTAGAGNFILLNPDAFAAAEVIKIRSGTNGSPVSQAQDSTLQLVLRDW